MRYTHTDVAFDSTYPLILTRPRIDTLNFLVFGLDPSASPFYFPNSGFLPRVRSIEHDSTDVFNSDTYLTASFQTGAAKHKVTAGFDYMRYSTDREALSMIDITPFNIFNPTPGVPAFYFGLDPLGLDIDFEYSGRSQDRTSAEANGPLRAGPDEARSVDRGVGRATGLADDRSRRWRVQGRIVDHLLRRADVRDQVRLQPVRQLQPVVHAATRSRGGRYALHRPCPAHACWPDQGRADRGRLQVSAEGRAARRQRRGVRHQGRESDCVARIDGIRRSRRRQLAHPRLRVRADRPTHARAEGARSLHPI